MVSKGRAFVGVEVCLDREWKYESVGGWGAIPDTVLWIIRKIKRDTRDCYLAVTDEYYPHVDTIAFLGGSRWGWLENYSCKLDTAEISFMYGLEPSCHTPTETAFDIMRRKSPAGFSIALTQTIPEFKEIGDIDRWFKIFFNNASRLEDKLKVIVWTFYSAKLDMGMLSELAARFAQFSGIRHAFQFPEKSWFCPRVFDVLAERGMTLCLTDPVTSETERTAGQREGDVGDMPQKDRAQDLVAEKLWCSRPPFSTDPRPILGNFLYIKKAGPSSWVSGLGFEHIRDFSHEELIEDARWIRTQLNKGRDVFVYFCNETFYTAMKNAQTLRDLLRE